jgi:hypothetical protein
LILDSLERLSSRGAAKPRRGISSNAIADAKATTVAGEMPRGRSG